MAKFCKWKANTVLNSYPSSEEEEPEINQIIADHTIVADYDKIPAEYMTIVKTMMVAFPGESHSLAYRTGMELLEALDEDYACNVATGEAPSSSYVRVNNSACGESAWYTWYAYADHAGINKDLVKNVIAEYNTHGHPFNVLGFGWCWDMTQTNTVTESKDPVYACGWAGCSVDGPDGNLAWGLDSDDYAITNNRVCMDTYLAATEDYITYCSTQEINTKVVFTTGPIDGDYDTENGYQRYLKHEHIRNYVTANSTRILFDYADILSFDDDGTPATGTWNGHTFQHITTTNLGDGDIGHIGAAGCVRLAKAQWWLLARIAGWDGN